VGNLNIQQLDDTCLLTLEGEMTIYQAESLASEIKPLIESEEHLSIDLSGVTGLDSSGVQLLMMAKKYCLETNRKLNLINHSQAVVAVFELLGMIGWFNDPLVISAQTENEGG
jgi:anti-anti-sigma factor